MRVYDLDSLYIDSVPWENIGIFIDCLSIITATRSVRLMIHIATIGGNKNCAIFRYTEKLESK